MLVKEKFSRLRHEETKEKIKGIKIKLGGKDWRTKIRGNKWEKRKFCPLPISSFQFHQVWVITKASSLPREANSQFKSAALKLLEVYCRGERASKVDPRESLSGISSDRRQLTQDERLHSGEEGETCDMRRGAEGVVNERSLTIFFLFKYLFLLTLSHRKGKGNFPLYFSSYFPSTWIHILWTTIWKSFHGKVSIISYESWGR